VNLFYTEDDPRAAAVSLCDKHVVKNDLRKLLRCLALLIGSQRRPQAPFVYKVTHSNHPSTKWLRSSQIAYKWGLEHLQALFQEYTYRYGKVHKTET
jgi:hypothetical protein